MPDPQEPRTGGVAVARIGDKYLTKPQVADLLRLGGGFSAPAENGRWFPLAEAEAREAVVAAAREYAEAIEPDAWQRFDTAYVKRTYRALVAALDALRKVDA